MTVIHIVEDDPQVRELIKQVLTSGDRQIYIYEKGEDLLSRFPTVLIDVAVLDFDLPGKNGLELLHAIKEQFPEVEVIMMTGVGDDAIAHKAMEDGAYDYLNKPLNPQEIRRVVQGAIHSKQTSGTSAYLFDQQRNLIGFGGVIGRSSSMKQAFKTIKMLSESPATPVVIRGETGTGKSLVARAIHSNSQGDSSPFFQVTCRALQPTTLEHELFGIEQDVFTGKKSSHPGLIEMADGGTLFMNEIADLDITLQLKLLEVLENKKCRRIGGTEEYPVHLRVIASTTRSLEQLVRKDTFRQKLYYRLNVITIDLPALRNRGEDILLLAEHFIKLYNNDLGFDVTGLTAHAQNKLLHYPWPGNVSELRNVIEHAVLLKRSGTIDKHHLIFTPFALEKVSPSASSDGDIVIPPEGIDFWEVEKSYLFRALELADGDHEQAAKLLGMTKSAYRTRLGKYNNLNGE